MNAFTDIEESKKLTDVLPAESADMSWVDYGFGNPFARTMPCQGDLEEICPCWSLAALVEQLPVIEGGRPLISFDLNGNCDISYVHALTVGSPYVHASNLLDACVEMIYKLKEKDLL